MLPDISGKPVELWIVILRTLLSTNMSVNKLVQQTSLSYKKRVTDAIKLLERASIIDSKKDPNHSQKDIKYLTDLGKVIGSLRNFGGAIF